jgi:L-aspartate oxidase
VTTRRLDADLVVIGTGVAGLSAALAAAPRRVVLITKATLTSGSASVWARGGMAVAVGAGDDPSHHAADTLAVAGGLADPQRVETVTALAPEVLAQLIELGVPFDRRADGELDLGREAAHSAARIVHAAGDATGREVVATMAAAVRAAAHIEVLEHALVDELLGTDGRVGGVAGEQSGRRFEVRAAAVVLATGGIGQVWQATTNPTSATGDGLALGLRAGARARDLEMVQFHPTALAVEQDPLPLLTEALRGAGAVLVNDRGDRFMVDRHELAELAPRDIVAGAIAAELAAGRRVFLDARTRPGAGFAEKFPSALEACGEAGLDPEVDLLPVTPAAHYHMGGLATDAEGRTSLPGLFAVGEVAALGIHGANRLASNSLIEGLVMGRIAAAAAAAEDPVELVGSLRPIASLRAKGPSGPAAAARHAVREAVWSGLGVVRNADGLVALLGDLERLRSMCERAGGELAAMWTVAAATAVAALARCESRGAHQRRDYSRTAGEARSQWIEWAAVESWFGAHAAGVASARRAAVATR